MPFDFISGPDYCFAQNEATAAKGRAWMSSSRRIAFLSACIASLNSLFFRRKHLVMKNLNIGLIGYGFMGRAHSNAFRKVSNFFDLEYQPVLKAVCARDKDKVKAFAK